MAAGPLVRFERQKLKAIYEKRPWLRLYPEWVPADLEIPNQTALDDFENAANQSPGKPAIYYFDRVITYRELNAFSNRLAWALSDWGIKKGDRIMVVLQNIPQFPISLYGAWKTGAIVVPLNPMYKEKELRYFCQDSGARILIIQDDVAAGLDLGFLKETSIEKVITTSPLDLLIHPDEPPVLLKGFKKITLPGTLDLMEVTAPYKEERLKQPDLSPADIAYLTYTSGTTGPPKGAMNTHGNIVFNARIYQIFMQMGDEDVILGAAPLFHVTGEIGHLANAALVGCPIILYYRFDAGETLRMIERWKATMTIAAITVYIALMNHPDIHKRDLSSLKKAYSGGAPVSAAVVDQFKALTGLVIHNAYGMTETTSPSHLVPLGMPTPVDPESGALSVGLPVSNTVVKIMDLESGTRELPPDDTGEIVDFGPMVVPGYWQKSEETRHAIREGWLYTGDVGKMDEAGWFYLVDRKKDLIVASGYKVWPRDVEDVIYQHPAVKETAVIGVPDPYRGETVKAFVTLKPGREHSVTPEEIIAFCKERMAAYKYPRQVELVSEIPKTLTGKLLRRDLREKEIADRRDPTHKNP
ncbi:MAG: AMP-binding protein [Deltaproteobacteria bacterium]|nr:AMP-binding protein [Deltaproteobacteria bacterium]